MVESLSSVTSGEKAFLTFLVNWIVDKSPGDLITNLGDMAKYMTDKMPPKCPENLYRK